MSAAKKRGRRQPYENAGISDFATVPGNDEFPGESVTISLRDGVAMMRPASFDRLDDDQRDAAAELQHIAGHRRKLAEMLDEAVVDARDLGLSWGQIGWCIGTSSQNAQKRWSGARR